jgi:hypothetical protein
VKLCRLRIEQLGISYETLDEICGFPTRYTSKPLAGAKTCSVYSLFTIARALALSPSLNLNGCRNIRLGCQSRTRVGWVGQERLVEAPLT